MRILRPAGRRRAARPAQCRRHPLPLQPGNSPLFLPHPVQHAHAGRQAAHLAGSPQRRHGHLQRRHHRHGRDDGTAHRVCFHLERAGGTIHSHQPAQPHSGHSAGEPPAADGRRGIGDRRPVPLHQPHRLPALCRRTLATEQGCGEEVLIYRYQLGYRGRPADDARLQSFR